MSQHDLNITQADADEGVDYRAAVNAALQALGSCSSGATAPATTYAYQLWADTTTYRMRLRNKTNTAWIDKGALLRGSSNSVSIICTSGANVKSLTEAEINYESLFFAINTSAASSLVFTLPAPSQSLNGVKITIKKTNLSGSNITINVVDGSLLDGDSTFTLISQYQIVDIYCDGTKWNMLAYANNKIKTSVAYGIIENNGYIYLKSYGTLYESGIITVRPDYSIMQLNNSNDFNKTSSVKTISERVEIKAANLNVMAPSSNMQTAPYAYNAPGNTGDIRFTESHIYVCVATNTWKRSALSTW